MTMIEKNVFSFITYNMSNHTSYYKETAQNALCI